VASWINRLCKVLTANLCQGHAVIPTYQTLINFQTWFKYTCSPPPSAVDTERKVPGSYPSSASSLLHTPRTDTYPLDALVATWPSVVTVPGQPGAQ
jgi:hypothetical protein